MGHWDVLDCCFSSFPCASTGLAALQRGVLQEKKSLLGTSWPNLPTQLGKMSNRPPTEVLLVGLQPVPHLED